MLPGEQIVGLQVDQHLALAHLLTFFDLYTCHPSADARTESNFVHLDEPRRLLHARVALAIHQGRH